PHVLIAFLRAHAPTRTHTISLHDALPILSRSCVRPRTRRTAPRTHSFKRACRRAGGVSASSSASVRAGFAADVVSALCARGARRDRKSTRLNSSHVKISYAVFCLKKKTKS